MVIKTKLPPLPTVTKIPSISLKDMERLVSSAITVLLERAQLGKSQRANSQRAVDSMLDDPQFVQKVYYALGLEMEGRMDALGTMTKDEAKDLLNIVRNIKTVERKLTDNAAPLLAEAPNEDSHLGTEGTEPRFRRLIEGRGRKR